MVSSIGGYSSLQALNALNAFKSVSASRETAKTPFEVESSSGVKLNNDNILDDVDVVDIKNYATKMGESNLTDDDIKYGITYGRSVIANYIA